MTDTKFLIYLVFLLLSSPFLFSQVGINTITPRTTLEVAGNANIDGKVDIKTIDEITQNEEVTFLMQSPTNFVKEIDASNGGFAIAYFQEYIISNMEQGTGDWVQNFNTNIPSSEYVVTVISAYYNQALKMNGAESNFAVPYVSAFIQDNTWRIVADYPSANNKDGSATKGVWIINTFILSRSFSKILTTQTHNLNGGTSGVASDAVIK